MAIVHAMRDGETVAATWSAEPRYQYIWAVCSAPGYEKWVAVRSESWEDALLEWDGVPETAKVALMSPKMSGERRIWRTIATDEV